MSKSICERLYAASCIASWEKICSEESEKLWSLDCCLILFLLGTHKMNHIFHLNVPGHRYTEHQVGMTWVVQCGHHGSHGTTMHLTWVSYYISIAAVGFLVNSSMNILCRANNFFQDTLTLWLYSMCDKYLAVFLSHQLCVFFPWWLICSF